MKLATALMCVALVEARLRGTNDRRLTAHLELSHDWVSGVYRWPGRILTRQ